jgi:hypothetical protein
MMKNWDDEPVMAPLALAIVESPARYTVCARFEISALGAARAVAASASAETTCEYSIFSIQVDNKILLRLFESQRMNQ